MPDDAPDQIKPYLDHIADRLWANNAAVIVGAGFSQNATPVGSTSSRFPLWQDLGNAFYEELHRRPPGEEARFLSPLKLAEQVEAAFGRPALDKLLRRTIPDLSYEPSPLHGQLLNLPWRDVFTTNYDTLLERACSLAPLKPYEIVVTEDDLLHTTAPRILKLHGGFPSGPFVITEEDYRRYPTNHALFVNTLRQSLLENTLCLIGFSGDDPNFLQWIGWIRDHLGHDTAPKIYLIDVSDALTAADRRLLDQRGIVTVDVSAFSPDPERAIDVFLDYLKSCKPRPLVWPTVPPEIESWATDADADKYRDIAAEWRRQRVEYPGWVVVPEDQRRLLWHHTEHWLSHFAQMLSTDRERLDTPLDLDLAFELAWRLDRCLFPLIPDLPSFFKNVATKYSDPTLTWPEESGWTPTTVFNAVAHLRLCLLRYYRETGLVDDWQEVNQTMAADFGKLLPDTRARLRLEDALHALFCLNPAEAKKLLLNWQSDETLPFWEAKRAALLAELGETATAHSILVSSLSTIRQRMNPKAVPEDYTLISQESVVMLLLSVVERAKSVPELYSEASTLLDELSDRWNELTRHNCDPRREIASLSAHLRQTPKGAQQVSETPTFDLGMVSRTVDIQPYDELVAAYGLLRLYEDIGMPYRVETAAFDVAPITSTLPRIRPYSPHWAFVNIVRLGDAKAADALLDREYLLSDLERVDVEAFCELYLPTFEHAIAMVDDPDWSVARTFEPLTKTLPEVFSRLCYKTSPDRREHLVSTLRAIYRSKRRKVFAGVRQFATRLFNSMSIDEGVSVLPSLIDLPMPDDLRGLERQEFANPVLLVGQPTLRGRKLPVTAARIDELLDQLAENGPDRDWTATKLVWLLDRDKLSAAQSARLGKILWDDVEASGVPVVSGFYSFVCMRLPPLAGLDPEPRVKDRLRTMIGTRNEGRSVDDVFDELRNSTEWVKWSRAEAMDLFARVDAWWKGHKHWLNQHALGPFGSPSENIRRTTQKALLALSEVFSRLPEADGGESVAGLPSFLEDLAANDIHTRGLEAATLSRVGEGHERLCRQVAAAMLHHDHHVVVDALTAARFLASTSTGTEGRRNFASVTTMLVQGVQWRHRPALAFRLRIVAGLVENYPWFLTPEAMDAVLTGIREIAEETSSGVRGNDQDGLIPIRADAALLASALFVYCRKSRSPEPETIRRWRELCSDPDEFSEVKNAWRGAGGDE